MNGEAARPLTVPESKLKQSTSLQNTRGSGHQTSIHRSKSISDSMDIQSQFPTDQYTQISQSPSVRSCRSCSSFDDVDDTKGLLPNDTFEDDGGYSVRKTGKWFERQDTQFSCDDPKVERKVTSFSCYVPTRKNTVVGKNGPIQYYIPSRGLDQGDSWFPRPVLQNKDPKTVQSTASTIKPVIDSLGLQMKNVKLHSPVVVSDSSARQPSEQAEQKPPGEETDVSSDTPSQTVLRLAKRETDFSCDSPFERQWTSQTTTSIRSSSFSNVSPHSKPLETQPKFKRRETVFSCSPSPSIQSARATRDSESQRSSQLGGGTTRRDTEFSCYVPDISAGKKASTLQVEVERTGTEFSCYVPDLSESQKPSLGNMQSITPTIEVPVERAGTEFSCHVPGVSTSEETPTLEEAVERTGTELSCDVPDLPTSQKPSLARTQSLTPTLDVLVERTETEFSCYVPDLSGSQKPSLAKAQPLSTGMDLSSYPKTRFSQVSKSAPGRNGLPKIDTKSFGKEIEFSGTTKSALESLGKETEFSRTTKLTLEQAAILQPKAALAGKGYNQRQPTNSQFLDLDTQIVADTEEMAVVSSFPSTEVARNRVSFQLPSEELTVETDLSQVASIKSTKVQSTEVMSTEEEYTVIKSAEVKSAEIESTEEDYVAPVALQQGSFANFRISGFLQPGTPVSQISPRTTGLEIAGVAIESIPEQIIPTVMPSQIALSGLDVINVAVESIPEQKTPAMMPTRIPSMRGSTVRSVSQRDRSPRGSKDLRIVSSDSDLKETTKVPSLVSILKMTQPTIQVIKNIESSQAQSGDISSTASNILAPEVVTTSTKEKSKTPSLRSGSSKRSEVARHPLLGAFTATSSAIDMGLPIPPMLSPDIAAAPGVGSGLESLAVALKHTESATPTGMPNVSSLPMRVPNARREPTPVEVTVRGSPKEQLALIHSKNIAKSGTAQTLALSLEESTMQQSSKEQLIHVPSESMVKVETAQSITPVLAMQQALNEQLALAPSINMAESKMAQTITLTSDETIVQQSSKEQLTLIPSMSVAKFETAQPITASLEETAVKPSSLEQLLFVSSNNIAKSGTAQRTALSSEEDVVSQPSLEQLLLISSNNVVKSETAQLTLPSTEEASVEQSSNEKLIVIPSSDIAKPKLAQTAILFPEQLQTRLDSTIDKKTELSSNEPAVQQSKELLITSSKNLTRFGAAQSTIPSSEQLKSQVIETAYRETALAPSEITIQQSSEERLILGSSKNMATSRIIQPIIPSSKQLESQSVETSGRGTELAFNEAAVQQSSKKNPLFISSENGATSGTSQLIIPSSERLESQLIGITEKETELTTVETLPTSVLLSESREDLTILTRNLKLDETIVNEPPLKLAVKSEISTAPDVRATTVEEESLFKLAIKSEAPIAREVDAATVEEDKPLLKLTVKSDISTTPQTDTVTVEDETSLKLTAKSEASTTREVDVTTLKDEPTSKLAAKSGISATPGADEPLFELAMDSEAPIPQETAVNTVGDEQPFELTVESGRLITPKVDTTTEGEPRFKLAIKSELSTTPEAYAAMMEDQSPFKLAVKSETLSTRDATTVEDESSLKLAIKSGMSATSEIHAITAEDSPNSKYGDELISKPLEPQLNHTAVKREILATSEVSATTMEGSPNPKSSSESILKPQEAQLNQTAFKSVKSEVSTAAEVFTLTAQISQKSNPRNEVIPKAIEIQPNEAVFKVAKSEISATSEVFATTVEISPKPKSRNDLTPKALEPQQNEAAFGSNQRKLPSFSMSNSEPQLLEGLGTGSLSARTLVSGNKNGPHQLAADLRTDLSSGPGAEKSFRTQKSQIQSAIETANVSLPSTLDKAAGPDAEITSRTEELQIQSGIETVNVSLLSNLQKTPKPNIEESTRTEEFEIQSDRETANVLLISNLHEIVEPDFQKIFRTEELQTQSNVEIANTPLLSNLQKTLESDSKTGSWIEKAQVQSVPETANISLPIDLQKILGFEIQKSQAEEVRIQAKREAVGVILPKGDLETSSRTEEVQIQVGSKTMGVMLPQENMVISSRNEQAQIQAGPETVRVAFPPKENTAKSPRTNEVQIQSKLETDRVILPKGDFEKPWTEEVRIQLGPTTALNASSPDGDAEQISRTEEAQIQSDLKTTLDISLPKENAEKISRTERVQIQSGPDSANVPLPKEIRDTTLVAQKASQRQSRIVTVRLSPERDDEVLAVVDTSPGGTEAAFVLLPKTVGEIATSTQNPSQDQSKIGIASLSVKKDIEVFSDTFRISTKAAVPLPETMVVSTQDKPTIGIAALSAEKNDEAFATLDPSSVGMEAAGAPLSETTKNTTAPTQEIGIITLLTEKDEAFATQDTSLVDVAAAAAFLPEKTASASASTRETNIAALSTEENGEVLATLDTSSVGIVESATAIFQETLENTIATTQNSSREQVKSMPSPLPKTMRDITVTTRKASQDQIEPKDVPLPDTTGDITAPPRNTSREYINSPPIPIPKTTGNTAATTQKTSQIQIESIPSPMPASIINISIATQKISESQIESVSVALPTSITPAAAWEDFRDQINPESIPFPESSTHTLAAWKAPRDQIELASTPLPINSANTPTTNWKASQDQVKSASMPLLASIVSVSATATSRTGEDQIEPAFIPLPASVANTPAATRNASLQNDKLVNISLPANVVSEPAIQNSSPRDKKAVAISLPANFVNKSAIQEASIRNIQAVDAALPTNVVNASTTLNLSLQNGKFVDAPLSASGSGTLLAAENTSLQRDKSAEVLLPASVSKSSAIWKLSLQRDNPVDISVPESITGTPPATRNASLQRDKSVGISLPTDIPSTSPAARKISFYNNPVDIPLPASAVNTPPASRNASLQRYHPAEIPLPVTTTNSPVEQTQMSRALTSDMNVEYWGFVPAVEKETQEIIESVVQGAFQDAVRKAVQETPLPAATSMSDSSTAYRMMIAESLDNAVKTASEYLRRSSQKRNSLQPDLPDMQTAKQGFEDIFIGEREFSDNMERVTRENMRKVDVQEETKTTDIQEEVGKVVILDELKTVVIQEGTEKIIAREELKSMAIREETEEIDALEGLKTVAIQKETEKVAALEETEKVDTLEELKSIAIEEETGKVTTLEDKRLDISLDEKDIINAKPEQRPSPSDGLIIRGMPNSSSYTPSQYSGIRSRQDSETTIRNIGGNKVALEFYSRVSTQEDKPLDTLSGQRATILERQSSPDVVVRSLHDHRSYTPSQYSGNQSRQDSASTIRIGGNKVALESYERLASTSRPVESADEPVDERGGALWKAWNALSGSRRSSYTAIPTRRSSFEGQATARRLSSKISPTHISGASTAIRNLSLGSIKEGARESSHLGFYFNDEPAVKDVTEGGNFVSKPPPTATRRKTAHWLKEMLTSTEPYATRLTALPPRIGRERLELQRSETAPAKPVEKLFLGATPKPVLPTKLPEGAETFSKTIFDVEQLLSEALELARKAVENGKADVIPVLENAAAVLRNGRPNLEAIPETVSKRNLRQSEFLSDSFDDQRMEAGSIHESIRSTYSEDRFSIGEDSDEDDRDEFCYHSPLQSEDEIEMENHIVIVESSPSPTKTWVGWPPTGRAATPFPPGSVLESTPSIEPGEAATDGVQAQGVQLGVSANSTEQEFVADIVKTQVPVTADPLLMVLRQGSVRETNIRLFKDRGLPEISNEDATELDIFIRQDEPRPVAKVGKMQVQEISEPSLKLVRQGSIREARNRFSEDRGLPEASNEDAQELDALIRQDDSRLVTDVVETQVQEIAEPPLILVRQGSVREARIRLSKDRGLPEVSDEDAQELDAFIGNNISSHENKDQPSREEKDESSRKEKYEARAISFPKPPRAPSGSDGRPRTLPNQREVRNFIKEYSQPPIAPRHSSLRLRAMAQAAERAHSAHTIPARTKPIRTTEIRVKGREAKQKAVASEEAKPSELPNGEKSPVGSSQLSLDGPPEEEVSQQPVAKMEVEIRRRVGGYQVEQPEASRQTARGEGHEGIPEEKAVESHELREMPLGQQLPTTTRRNARNKKLDELNLRGRSHVSLKEHHRFSLGRSKKRQPIARDWSKSRKRFVATVNCISTALIGILIGIYAGEVPSVQYYLADLHHYSILGNVFLFIGISIPTVFCWPLPLLHGRKPYILASLSVAMPLLFPQAVVVSAIRSPYEAYWRVGLLLPRAVMGFVLGFANMNFQATLLDLFGASLRSGNPHGEEIDEFDVRRHGGGMGPWLGLWTWCYIGSIGVGFTVGAVLINYLAPSWGMYIGIIILLFISVLNVLTPEVRRGAYRRSVAEVKTPDGVSRRVARGEVMMHRVQTGPKWFGQELYHGVMLSCDMLKQPGFMVLAVYQAWIYGQVVLMIVLLGSLTSNYYKFKSPLVGLSVAAIPLGAMCAIPFERASFFSRSRTEKARTNSNTFNEKFDWKSHIFRRALFTSSLPLVGIGYTATSHGPPIPWILPIIFAAAFGFLSNMAIAECVGIIMETWDTSDLQPGMTGRPRAGSGEDSANKRTNYSSFPRVASAFGITQGLGFLIAAIATGFGGVATRNLGQQVATGVMAGILIILTLLLFAVLVRWQDVQIIPDSKTAEMDLYMAQRRLTAMRPPGAPETEEPWRPIIIGNPTSKTRRMSIIELGSMTRWSEIRRKNRMYDETMAHPDREVLHQAHLRLQEKQQQVVRSVQGSLRSAHGSLKGRMSRQGSQRGKGKEREVKREVVETVEVELREV